MGTGLDRQLSPVERLARSHDNQLSTKYPPTVPTVWGAGGLPGMNNIATNTSTEITQSPTKQEITKPQSPGENIKPVASPAVAQGPAEVKPRETPAVTTTQPTSPQTKPQINKPSDQLYKLVSQCQQTFINPDTGNQIRNCLNEQKVDTNNISEPPYLLPSAVASTIVALKLGPMPYIADGINEAVNRDNETPSSSVVQNNLQTNGSFQLSNTTAAANKSQYKYDLLETAKRIIKLQGGKDGYINSPQLNGIVGKLIPQVDDSKVESIANRLGEAPQATRARLEFGRKQFAQSIVDSIMPSFGTIENGNYALGKHELATVLNYLSDGQGSINTDNALSRIRLLQNMYGPGRIDVRAQYMI